MTDIENQTEKYWLYCCITCIVLLALQFDVINIDNAISLPIISINISNSAVAEAFLLISAFTLYFFHEQNNKSNHFLYKKNTMASLSQEKFMIDFIELRVLKQQTHIYKSNIPNIISNSTISSLFTFKTLTHKTNGNGLIKPFKTNLNHPLTLYFKVNFFMLRHSFQEAINSKNSLDLLIPRLFVGAASIKPMYGYAFEFGACILQFSNIT